MTRRGETEWLKRGECGAVMPDGTKCVGTRRSSKPWTGPGSVDGILPLCFGHNRHFKLYGHPRTDIPLNAMQRMTFKERVEWYMNPANGYIKISPYGCILWQRTQLQAGYGLVNSKVIARECGTKNNVQTHRMMWVYSRGELPPEGMQVHHDCYNKACCNPDHLELTTPRENSNDASMMYKLRIKCARLLVDKRALTAQVKKLEKELAEIKLRTSTYAKKKTA